MRPLGEEARMALTSAVQRYAHDGDAVMPYLKERGITWQTAQRFKLGYTGGMPLPGHPAGRLSIPCLAADDHPVFLSFRALDDEKPKYLHIHGESRIFNSRAVVQAEDHIHVTEGQLDAVILEQCGLHAVGVMGASAWKSHHPRMFGGFSRVYVWTDADTPGEEFSRKVCDSLPRATPVRIKGEAKDVNELFLAGGREAIIEAFS